MYQVPNSDLLAAMARLPVPGSAAARDAAHRAELTKARRGQRRAWLVGLARLWGGRAARYMPRKAGKASEIHGT